MIVDNKKPRHHNMQFTESEQGQLIVFDELISESIETIKTTKTVIRNNKKTNNQPIEYTHIKLKFKKNVVDYNKFRKAKKKYLKQLTDKYSIKEKK